MASAGRQRTTSPQVRRTFAGDSSPIDDPMPIGINLGIDFGTSFTKVCFRNVGAEHSDIVPIIESTAGSVMLPSIVEIDARGRLYTSGGVPGAPGRVTVRHLKMRLAGAPIDGNLPAVQGYDLGEDSICRVLSSWFLAKVIVRAQQWVEANHAEELRNRRVEWSANLGVPVEYYDSPLLEVFNEVLKVAWCWAVRTYAPVDVREAVQAYKAERASSTGAVDFHAIPEIAAAVHSFVMSGQAAPGIYFYFDIGGGTIDGVAFRFANYGGERHVDFYSGKVSPLGTVTLARFLGHTADTEADVRAVQRILRSGGRKVRALAEQVQLLVSYVVMTAKRKDRQDWKTGGIEQFAEGRKRVGGIAAREAMPITVFIGGGGSHWEWYRKVIAETYERFHHDRAGIPPYRIEDVPTPLDFGHGDLPAEVFKELAIAYGLSIPFGEGPEIGLPSQFDVPPSDEPQRPLALGHDFTAK